MPAAFQADRNSIAKRSKPPNAVSAPDFNYETLETLAGKTGGRAFHHINDLVEVGYNAFVTIDPRNITLEPKDGNRAGSLQFLVVVGNVEQLTTIPLNLTEATFHQIQDKGLVLGARVKTPPGTTGFSLRFRDMPPGACAHGSGFGSHSNK